MTVTMPQLGESVTEGTIARWLKQPGDAIAKYKSIAEVITDKVNAEIPAPADGVMSELIAPEGTVVPVGQPICSIDAGDGAAAAPAPAAASDTGSRMSLSAGPLPSAPGRLRNLCRRHRFRSSRPEPESPRLRADSGRVHVRRRPRPDRSYRSWRLAGQRAGRRISRDPGGPHARS